MRNFPHGTGPGERFTDDGNTALPAPWAEEPGRWLERAQGRGGEATDPDGPGAEGQAADGRQVKGAAPGRHSGEATDPEGPGAEGSAPSGCQVKGADPGGRGGQVADPGAPYVQVGAGTCPWPMSRSAPLTALRERPVADRSAENSPAPADVTGSAPRLPAGHPPAPYELHRAAAEFLTLHHTEDRLGDPARRIAAAHTEIARTGTYRHTTEELVFGARVAWRNANRCIGRLYWHSLRVRDRRDVRDTRDVAEAAADHLREATRDGRIRALITVFAPDEPGRPGPRIWNEQLIRYAGYTSPDGTVTGDPRNAGLTAFAHRLGWPGGSGTPFDVLPLVIQGADDKPRWFALPPDAVLEVELAHPEYPWWRALGLRRHAVPALANMCLDIGGVCYPAAPLNGWYMGTEIGARNLADTDLPHSLKGMGGTPIDLLPHIAEPLGLDTRTDRSLWKDRALVELNRSVLHSFDRAGVTVTDHHTESRRFLTHLGREERKGRRVGADWSWIVPPISGSATPVFHRTYEAVERSPAYVHHPEAHERARGTILV